MKIRVMHEKILQIKLSGVHTSWVCDEFSAVNRDVRM
jgi:hypothetical protein